MTSSVSPDSPELLPCSYRPEDGNMGDVVHRCRYCGVHEGSPAGRSCQGWNKATKSRMEPSLPQPEGMGSLTDALKAGAMEAFDARWRHFGNHLSRVSEWEQGQYRAWFLDGWAHALAHPSTPENSNPLTDELPKVRREMVFKHFGSDVGHPLLRTVWKDGIDLEVPTYALQCYRNLR